MISPGNFTCTNIQSVFVCKANNLATLALFQRLQGIVHECCLRLLQKRQGVPPMTDGILGPLMVLGVQRTLTALNHWQAVPQNLEVFLGYQASEEELVKRLGEFSDELIGYITLVLQQYPNALIQMPPSKKIGLNSTSVDSDLKSKLRMLAFAGASLGTAGGLFYVTRKASRHRKGLEDQVNKLSEDDESSNDSSEEE